LLPIPNNRGLKALETNISSGKFRVLSLDVFDTLLLRGLPPELSRFRRLAERLARTEFCRASGITAKNIFEARLQCSHIAYLSAPRLQGVRETSIEHILRLQLAWLGLAPELWPEFLKVELELESEVTYANRPLVRICSHAKLQPLRVVATSDMYLDADSIEGLLLHHGIGGLCDRVYVSGEHRKCKRSGHLFAELAKQEGVAVREILHAGDSWIADYAVPSALGMTAIWLPRSFGWKIANGVWNRALRFA